MSIKIFTANFGIQTKKSEDEKRKIEFATIDVNVSIQLDSSSPRFNWFMFMIFDNSAKE